MFKIGLLTICATALAIALALPIRVGFAIEKIVLICSGWVASKSPNAVIDVHNLKLVIDPDQAVVTGTLGELPLDVSSEVRFGFEVLLKSGGETMGSIDRITGQTSVSTWDKDDYTFYDSPASQRSPSSRVAAAPSAQSSRDDQGH